MARVTLKFEAVCRDCGASLPVGSRVRYYGPGRIYGTKCHPRRTVANTFIERSHPEYREMEMEMGVR